MLGYFLTDTGRVRNHNEDAGGIFYNMDRQALAVVADGMGGHRAGDVASFLAASTLHKKWKETKGFDSPEKAELWLNEQIHKVNDVIFEKAIQNEEYQGMGTTVVAAICAEDFVTVGHIGDSRGYVSNSFGFTQITEDHSLVNELIRSGQLTPEDAEHHPRKHVLLKALGTEKNISIDTKTIGWEQDNLLLLCSDGLSNKVSDEELHRYLIEGDSLEHSAHQLVSLANERGGEDNISLAIIHHSSDEGDE
ncbi:Stp1/IreP family PP2C-type Ser/Thr phosphatase [Salirhabdus salicampi]|uniref:Stp1/IreP family PP2C-type Ser/Thr phosphatase n=1 Tax=Salirhabdus salicampi TaxID=476102 RepID=UPI0020C2999C|nr:Stp1/IreP family PP2C-type Ser/Thr phosphatase [Salirhabdus salicampi]MCP8616570.1 Stp1/IreP family PP2C-type Ser/Thr phosphatase [Salirhabdus salicampi]